MISPCKDCLDRKAECHSNCGKYDEWKEYMSGIQEIKNKENALRADFRARSYERYIKAKKRSYPGKRVFNSLKSLKREKMRIAKELGYSHECYMKIYNAKTSEEIDNVLRQERLGKNG